MNTFYFFSGRGDELAGICLRFSHSVKWSKQFIKLVKSMETGFRGRGDTDACVICRDLGEAALLFLKNHLVLTPRINKVCGKKGGDVLRLK